MEEKNNEQMISVAKVDATIDQVLIKDTDVLIESINKSKAGLILDDALSLSGTPMIQLVVVKVGDAVQKYQVGDVVYELSNTNSPSYFEAEDRNLLLTDAYNIKLAVRK